jgi:hypothetical protein
LAPTWTTGSSWSSGLPFIFPSCFITGLNPSLAYNSPLIAHIFRIEETRLVNELQRQAYLQALGVDAYYPRWLLPCAPGSQLCVQIWPEANSDLAHESFEHLSRSDLQIAVASNQSASPIAVADVLQALELQPVRPKKPVGPVYQSAEVTKRIAPFALSIWRPFTSWLVIDERQPQAALPVELLLQNILFSFGRLSSPLAEEVLRWPLVENAVIPQTAAEARQALSVWLEVELERRPVKCLLLMGPKAAEFFLSDKSYDEQLWKVADLSIPGLQALVTPSLVELLRNPLLKGELWRAFASLDLSK